MWGADPCAPHLRPEWRNERGDPENGAALELFSRLGGRPWATRCQRGSGPVRSPWFA